MRFAVLTALFVFLSTVCASPVHVKARHNPEADLAILKRSSSTQGLGSTGGPLLKRMKALRDQDLRREWHMVANIGSGTSGPVELRGGIYIAKYKLKPDEKSMDNAKIRKLVEKHCGGCTIKNYHQDGNEVYYTYPKSAH